MKATAALLTAILMLSACATTNTEKIPGQYAVVVDSSQPRYGFPAEAIVESLRERLGTVDLVDTADAGSYDAVIVLKPHRPVRSYLSSSFSRRPREIWKKEHGEPGPRRTRNLMQVVEFEIVRGGRNVAHGAARYDRFPNEEEPFQGSFAAGPYVRTHPTAGIEVARAVVKALRGAG